MALGLVRHLPFLAATTRSGKWDPLCTGKLRRPSTMTLGIVGFGRTGRHLAQLSRAVFRRIAAFDPAVPDRDWPDFVERREMHEVFSGSDVISLHLPLTPQTENLVDAEMLRTMRHGSYLINVSRGGLLDCDALIDSLNAGHLAGAALDVLPVEPPAPGDTVLSHPRIMVTPHAAYYSVNSEEELRRKAVENILGWAETGRPVYTVVEGA